MKKRNILLLFGVVFFLISCVMREDIRFNANGKASFSQKIDLSKFIEFSNKMQKKNNKPIDEISKDTVVYLDQLIAELPDSLSESEKVKIRTELAKLKGFKVEARMRNVPGEKPNFVFSWGTDDLDFNSFFDPENKRSLWDVLSGLNELEGKGKAPKEVNTFDNLYTPKHNLTKNSYTRSYTFTPKGKAELQENKQYGDSLQDALNGIARLFTDSADLNIAKLMQYEQTVQFAKPVKSFRGYSARLSEDKMTITTNISPWDILSKGDSTHLFVRF